MGEKVTLKDTIQIWVKAVQYLEDGDIDSSLENFEDIVETSAKMYYNVGSLWFRKRNYAKANVHFVTCVERDPHMALGHFALGLTYFKLKQYHKSRRSYEKAQTCLRGNPKKIDYSQLGLKFALWECDIIYNMGATIAAMAEEKEWALEVLENGLSTAKEEKQKARMNEAITSLKRKVVYEVISLPDEVFKPPKSKVDNLKDIDYLGEKKVISSLSIKQKPADKLSIPSSPTNKSQTPSPALGKDTNRRLPPSIPPPPNPKIAFRPIQDVEEKEKMTHKDSLIIWHEGVIAFEKGNINQALEEWLKINDPSAIQLFNIAVAQLQLKDAEGAERTCHGIINKDEYLVIGHYLLGEVQCKLRHFDDAWKSFDKALSHLRNHSKIDYLQRGLAHKIYKCEILLNQAFCYYHSGMDEWTAHLLEEAKSLKVEPKHSVIDEAIKKHSRLQQFDFIPLPANAVFKPPKSKIDNLAKQKFLDEAKVVSQLGGTKQEAEEPPKPSKIPPHLSTPPRAPSPVRPPPPVTAAMPSKPRSGPPNIPPPPARTVSKGSGGRSSPGPPSRLPPSVPPPSLPVSRSKSPNPVLKGPPHKQLPPPPKVTSSRPVKNVSSSAFDPDKSLPPTPQSESPVTSASSSPTMPRRRGPPTKAVPLPPVGKNSSSSSVSSSKSSSPSTSRSQSPFPQVKGKASNGPPQKPVPPSPLSGSPGSKSPVSGSPQSGSPRSMSPVKGLQGPLRQPPPKPLKAPGQNSSASEATGKQGGIKKRLSGIVTSGFDGNGEEELSVSEGDIITIISQDSQWTEGELRGRRGRFPTQCIQDLSIRSSNFKR